MFITASKLYDYIQCPHRVWRDVHGPQDEKIEETNDFVELLWEKGLQHEENILKTLGEFVNLKEGSIDERFNKTLQEMKRGTELIYQGVIKHENLLGVPDILRKLSSGKYIPIDIKSGKGTEGADSFDSDEAKPKKHYAVQLCLYIEILRHLGFSGDKNVGIIIDISGSEVEYDLDAPQGPRNTKSWWEEYLEIKSQVQALIENQSQNKPAFAGICKLCHWYTSCRKWCEDEGDLTTMFYLGRSNRDILNNDMGIDKVSQFNDVDISDVLARKKAEKGFMKGFGETLLVKFKRRAEILTLTKKPVAHREINFPKVSVELFFDIEDDPTQNFVYLHGVYERKNGNERFIPFLAKENSDESEKEAWARFWGYIKSLPQDDYAIYYFSHHEKSTYRNMQKKYPDVISIEELEAFFDSPNAIDLYQVVQKYTDWPLSSYSLKEIATYLGFKWRDETPSGALSIKWYNEYLEKGSEEVLQRIVEYNEDDCKATMVLKDGVEKLTIV